MPPDPSPGDTSKGLTANGDNNMKMDKTEISHNEADKPDIF